MKTHRISVDIDEEEHKYLKMCCHKLGVTIKDFVLGATIERVDSWEDTWMLERWERDGTKEKLKKECNDPNRKLYEMVSINGETVFKETTYAEVAKRTHGL